MINRYSYMASGHGIKTLKIRYCAFPITTSTDVPLRVQYLSISNVPKKLRKAGFRSGSGLPTEKVFVLEARQDLFYNKDFSVAELSVRRN